MSGSDLSIFDVTFALKQFSGDQSLLMNILEKFLQQNKNFDSSLLQYLQEQDVAAAKQHVHTLKGVSGNLGFKALSQACKNLELSLANQVSEQKVNDFLQIFKQTLTLIKEHTAETAVQQNIDSATQLDKKAELITALKRNEFISESKMQSYIQSLDFSAEKRNELIDAIDSLDYPSAIKILE